MLLSRYAAPLSINIVLVALSQSVIAQQAPTAGSQLQQIAAPPVARKTEPVIRKEFGDAPAAPVVDRQKIRVNRLQFIGAKSVAEAELIRASGFEPGREVTLTELRDLATRVTSLYRHLGYFVAQAYLSAQDITDGVVRITVIEGQYGQVSLRNKSNVSDGVANSLLSGLNRNDPVTAAALERRILLLSDLPGVNVKSTLTPGASMGMSDLIIDISPGQRASGSITTDNQGNRYTGSTRAGASVMINEPTGLGDVASVQVLTSGEGLAYGRASYQAQLGKVKAGLAYASISYKLGEEFAASQSSGTAQISSLYASYPLIRSRSSNLNAQLAIDDKNFSDKAGPTTSSFITDKKARVIMAGLSGDYHPPLGGGTLSTFAFTWTGGNIELQNPAVLSNDTNSAQTNGRFTKLNYGFTGQQEAAAGTALYISINGQLASKNLDSSEKFSLGGASGVRAYPSGEASADEGAMLTLEARASLPSLAERLSGQLEFICFFDRGSVTLNKSPWAAVTTPNNRSLSGAGVGLNWVSTNNLLVKAYYAFKVGDEVATSAPDASGRFWLQVAKTF